MACLWLDVAPSQGRIPTGLFSPQEKPGRRPQNERPAKINSKVDANVGAVGLPVIAARSRGAFKLQRFRGKVAESILFGPANSQQFDLDLNFAECIFLPLNIYQFPLINQELKMIRLRIKNFGPIKAGLIENDGWIDFSRVTIFVGNQGSGKSSIAKLFSTFSWIEKALVRGDYEKKWFERKNRLRNQFLNYHRLDHYFDPQGLNTTEIEYQGEAFSMKYAQGQLTISENKTDAYHLPQVMYVPAERNFIAYVRNARELKLSSDSLKEFLTEFDNAKLNMKGVVHLPINGVELEYDKLNDLINIRDKNYRLRLTDASSGFQSLVPLFLVSQNLAKTVKAQSEDNARPMSADEVDRFKRGVENIFNNKALTEEQQRVAISVLSARFNKTAFINIVEEPEQNLFPNSQWEVLKCLLEFNNQTAHNRLIITTHSPYIINFMSIAVQGMNLIKKIQSIQPPNRALLTRLEAIISREALVAAEDLSIYQLDELTGSIVKLPTFEGIPTDRNFLNDTLRKGNAQFDELLAIEEELQA